MPSLVYNKKAAFNYEILERFEAGIELTGSEVKSLRAGLATFESTYVIIRGGEAWIINMKIPAYQPNNLVGRESSYDPGRNRRLLLTKPEIAKLASLGTGLTIVPITMYNKGRHIKVEIATVRGKKAFDKRETLKKRDTERQTRREYSDR